MTLNQAYKEFLEDSEYKELASNNRDAMNKIFLRKHFNVGVETLTKSFICEQLQSNDIYVRDKYRCASIIIHFLNWCAERKYCKAPSFDYNDLVDTSNCVEAPAKKDEETSKVEEKVEVKTINRVYSRGVVQIDPESLKPIRVWECIYQVKKELNIVNIKRAIQRHRPAGGFYWCYKGDEEGFKPAESKRKVKNQVVKKNKAVDDRKKEKQKPLGKEAQETQVPRKQLNQNTEEWEVNIDINSCSLDDLLRELKRRGWIGEVKIELSLQLK